MSGLHGALATIVACLPFRTPGSVPPFLGLACAPIRHIAFTNCPFRYLVTYLDLGNFCDKSPEISLLKIYVQVFLRFSDSSKPSQSVSLIYELALFAGIRKSEENLLKTSCEVASVTKVAHIF